VTQKQIEQTRAMVKEKKKLIEALHEIGNIKSDNIIELQ